MKQIQVNRVSFHCRGIAFSVCFLAALTSGLLLDANEAADSNRPNILFILVDDQRNDTLGCAGHPIIKTPHIDKLAHEGVRFENMFVNSSICMASRASIFTGLTETGHGFTSSGKPPANPVIEEDVATSFPALLKSSGYRNGFYGKNHVRFSEKTDDVFERMFDDYEVIMRNPYFKKQADGSFRHTAELIGDRSVAFLESQPDETPFCLYMSFNIGHAEDGDHRPGVGHFPWPKAEDGLYEDIEPLPPRLGHSLYFDAQPDFLKDSMNRDRWHWRWDDPEKYRINMRAYYRMLSGMDRIVGRVLDTLEQRGLAENTVVIYTADNGYYMGDRGFAGKWSHYEQSLRVPLIIYDPRLPEGQRNRVVSPMTMNIDLPATMLELAGIPVPRKYQGQSLLPILDGQKPLEWRTEFYCEHHHPNERIPKWRGVRGSRYTYARYYEQEPAFECLYDLKSDPDQLNNLAANPGFRETLQELRKRCESFEAEYTRPEITAYKKQLSSTINN